MNSPRNNISLQINLSASDLPICRQLLERQIGFWYDEVDEILLSVESQKSHGKFAVDFDANQAALTAFISTLAAAYPKLRYHYIDYSPARARVLSELFFAGVEIPHKDYRGGPFYCYFDGLAECRNRYIMHLDSDMILGGIPNTWLQDAVDLLRSDASYLFINPLAGPPRPDFGLRQEFHQRLGNYQFVFRKMSTRVFLTDRERLTAHPIRLRKINKTLRNWKWFFRSNMHWGYDLPELLITEMMQRDGMLRVDTYGRTDRDACYTLHPVLKPKAFIESLPELLRRIDSNDIPESQRGYYNVHNDFFDFEGVR